MTRVALTFDNGPTPEVTSKVLDELAARGLRAYFFVLGKHLETDEGKALVTRALAEGHRVGNHSYSHEVPLGDDPRPDAVEREIVATAQLLEALHASHAATQAADGILVQAKLFRPFGGGGIIGPHLLSPAAEDHLRAKGYTCLLWNSVPRDWDDPEGWSARALEACTPGAHVVVVLHDIPGACLAQLGTFLDQALARGVSFGLDLPEDCIPIERGMARRGLNAIVRGRRPDSAPPLR